ncbi:MAG TPA: 50S ribosomal protein L10 [Phycisphaerae bacterium]|nr:50S ribosomal protein L10 [Phycisphaerae bacterium]
MSKPVKKLVREELARRFEGVRELAVVALAGVDANETNAIRTRLHEKSIRVTVVKNSLARQAFEDVGIKEAGDLLVGPSAVAYGTDAEEVGIVTIVRELLDIHKATPNLTVKAAYMDGQKFGADEIDALSKYPTRDEAVAQVLGCVLSAGGNLLACLLGPASQIAGVLKTIEEKQGGAPDAEAA